MENEYNSTFNDQKENLLNQQELIRELVPLVPTNRGKRFGNYIIDSIGYYLLSLLFGLFFGFAIFLVSLLTGTDNAGLIESNWFTLIFYLISFLAYIAYFTLLEFYIGKTLGKVITKTKVVREDGSKISFNQALGRSLARLIPFEAFSYLGSNPIGWHDGLSKTIVVDDNRILEMLNEDKQQVY